MLRLALATLAARKSGVVGALAAVGLAVVLIVSCGILLQSSLDAPLPVARLQAASVVVQADTSARPAVGEADNGIVLEERARLPENLTRRIASLPGVAKAVGDRSVYATAVDRRGDVIEGEDGAPSAGHGWESSVLTPYALTSGHAPQRASEVVIDAQIAARGHFRRGERLRLLTATGPRTFEIAGVAEAPRSLRSAPQAAIFFRSDVAARLAPGNGRVDLIGVIARPGADPALVANGIRHELEGQHAQVLTGAARGDAESPDGALGREDIVAGLTVFATLAAFIAIFVVGSTFALSVQQRHRELALFRAIGSTPRQVRRMVAGEALIISMGAFVIAAPLGVLAAYAERGLFAKAGVVPEDLAIGVGWLPFAGGLVCAIITTQLAAFASARRAARVRPTEALREASVARRPVSATRAAIGLAGIAAGAAVLVLSARDAGGLEQADAPIAALVLCIAVAALGPALAWPFAWIAGAPLAAAGSGPGLLAWANTRANLRRAASVATPLMLAIAAVSSMYFAKVILHEATHEQTTRRTTAAFVLRPDGVSGLSTEVARAARRLPGVSGASGTALTTLLVAADGVNLRKVQARAVDEGTLGGVVDLDVAAGSLANLRGSAVAVSAASAKAWGWHVGDRVRVQLGDGTPATLRVVAQYRLPLGFGDVLVPRRLVADHVTRPLDDAVFVAGDPGGRTRSALQSLAAGNATIRVLDRAQYVSELDAEADRQSLAVYALLGLVVLFCALALVNALVMAIGERAREFAQLRLIGATRSQVRSMVRTETLIVIAFGLTMGVVISAPGLALLNHSLTGAFIPSVSPVILAGLVAFYIGLGLAALLLPMRGALRSNLVALVAPRE